jgi:hypothetical protein
MAITITQSDIEAVWGPTFVAQWSNVGGRKQALTADTTRIAAAVARGVSYVNGRLNNGPYGVPLTATDPLNPPVEIVDCMATYAGWWLYKTSGTLYQKDTLKWVQDNLTRINNMLLAIQIGNYPIDAALNTLRRQVPQVV